MTSKFQKRHYEALAEAIRNHEFGRSVNKPTDQQKQYRSNVIAGLITTIADMLEADSPNFNRERFIRRCGWH